MKKTSLYMVATCLLVSLQPLQSNSTTSIPEAHSTISTPSEFNETILLRLRLDEINAMDKETMNSSEKHKLRSEVLSIRNKFGEMRKSGGGNGGIYISAAGIIIILLLLIILL